MYEAIRGLHFLIVLTVDQVRSTVIRARYCGASWTNDMSFLGFIMILKRPVEPDGSLIQLDQTELLGNVFQLDINYRHYLFIVVF